MTLKDARKSAGLSQDKLSKKSNVSRTSIARYETGNQLPNWSTVILLSSALGIDPGELQFTLKAGA